MPTPERSALHKSPGAVRALLLEDCARIVGPQHVRASEVARAAYAYDNSPFRALPDAVAFPGGPAEVAALVQAAARHGFPVVPRGAGTGISGGAIPCHGGLLLVLTRMNRILEIDPVSRTALVEAGVVNLDLQKRLAPMGFMFAPDPASQKAATIGGNVAENAGGMRGIKYGVTRQHVLGLDVVLADGTVAGTGLLAGPEGPRPDLGGLWVGSEGTFGIVTRALLKLTRLPESWRTALAVFPRLEDAARAVSGMIARGIVPAALEIMDQVMLQAVEDFCRLGLPRDAEAVLLIEVDGWEAEMDGQLEAILAICRECAAVRVASARTPGEREQLWRARRSGNGALGRLRPAMMVQDITVPRGALPQLLQGVRAIGRRHDVIIAQMAHAGDGNGHPHLLFDPRNADERRRVEQASTEIFRLALELGGTLTGEHGVGLEKRDHLPLQFSPADLAAMARVREAFDPAGGLNPGKVLPAVETTPRAQGPAPTDPPAQGIRHRGALLPAAWSGRSEYPASAGEAAGLVRRLLAQGRRLVPCGRGQGLGCLGPAMDPEWVVVSTSRMTAVEELLPDNLSLRVQAGTTLSDIQATADRAGAWLPASVERHGHRSIGGLLAEGADGLEDFAWGPLRDHLLGIEFVSPQGELVVSGGRTVKNVAGYDLAPLHWGGLGAFGLVTAVTLKLSPRLEGRRLLLAEACGLGAALERAEALLHPPLGLLALRVMGARKPDGRIRWHLAAQLGGATETLATQVPLARRLLAPLPMQVLEEQAAADFWRAHFAAIQDSPPLRPLARGDRRTMLELLVGAGEALQGLDWSRLDIDLGCAALHLAAAGDGHQAAALATLARHRPGVGRLWLGNSRAPAGELHRRLKQALDPQDRFAPQQLRRAYAVRC